MAAIIGHCCKSIQHSTSTYCSYRHDNRQNILLLATGRTVVSEVKEVNVVKVAKLAAVLAVLTAMTFVAILL